MNTIEKELRAAIDNNAECDEDGCSLDIPKIISDGLSIVEKYAVGYDEWKIENNWEYFFIEVLDKKYLAWRNTADSTIKEKDSNELFQLYIQSLEK